MANQLNVSVLVAARDEYSNQLKRHLQPLVQEGFTSIWEDAVAENYSSPIEQFQIFLQDIRKWNQTILEEETKRILDKCSFLMELVTAIFISHVKILASVKLGGKHNNIRIRIPTADIFVHSIYVNCAETLFYNPELFQNPGDRNNYYQIRKIINTGIDDTVSSMIPIKNILEEYLSNTFDDHIKKDIDTSEENEDRETIDNSILTKNLPYDPPQDLPELNTQDIISDLPSFDETPSEPYVNQVKEVSIGDTALNTKTQEPSWNSPSEIDDGGIGDLLSTDSNDNNTQNIDDDVFSDTTINNFGNSSNNTSTSNDDFGNFNNTSSSNTSTSNDDFGNFNSSNTSSSNDDFGNFNSSNTSSSNDDFGNFNFFDSNNDDII